MRSAWLFKQNIVCGLCVQTFWHNKTVSSKHDVIVCSRIYTTVIPTDVSKDIKMLLISYIFYWVMVNIDLSVLSVIAERISSLESIAFKD